MTESCKFITDFLGCPYEVFAGETGGQAAVQQWNTLAQQGKTQGFYPLLIVVSDILEEAITLALKDEGLEPTPEGGAQFRAIALAQAQTLDAAAFLAQRLEEDAQYLTEGGELLGSFVEAQPDHAFHACHSSPFAPLELILAKIPAQHPWELAAWVPMGGFNDCPTPAQQVAVFRHWHQQYGAVPGVVTYDIWEMELTAPPTDNAAAEALAKEHFAFCTDIVLQSAPGWDTVRARASALKGSTTWLFWWD